MKNLLSKGQTCFSKFSGRKKHILFHCSLLIAICSLLMTACPPGGGGGGDGGEDPTGITLDKSVLNLISGQTERLSVSVEPLNANKTVTWSSDNASATVSWNGTVTAVSTGNAVITATTKGGLTASCSVTVWHTPTSIEVTQNPDKTWYVVGDDPVLDTYGLVVTSTYDGGTEIIPSDAVTVSGFNASSPGGREITVTWGGQSDTFTVTVVSITGINVGVPTPIKTALGEDLDILILERITVTATYSDGKGTEDVTSRITLANISGFNKNTSGVQTLTVSYRPQVNSNTGTFTVTVLEVSSIAVNTQPNKTKYAKGEALNITGLTITVTFTDTTTTTATPALADISVFDSSSIGVKTLTITYSGKTTTFTVTVIEVTSISVKTPPSKTRYAIGEALDISGLEIEATYNDSSKATIGTETINLSYISGFSSAAATASQTVTVTYAGKSATFTVKVYAVVTFNPNGGNWGGSTANQTTQTEGNTAVETPATAPTRTSYAFTGWYTQAEGGTKLDSATRITANTTLYAQWTFVLICTSVDDVSEYLASLPANTAADPISLPVQFDLGTMTEATSGWRQLLTAIDTAGKFVDLDLSRCTMNGTEFNPDYNVTTGKNRIVSIALPDVATSIVAGITTSIDNAFKNFTVLRSFSGIGLKIIGNNAFFLCSSLTMTSLPEGITSIGQLSFSYCYGLTQLTLPASLTTISATCFNACSNLVLVICLATVPPTAGGSIFNATHDNLRIEVPAASVAAYKAAAGWSTYADKIFAITP